jgi:hypothetical protein
MSELPLDDEIELRARRDGETVVGGIAEPAKVLRLGRMVRVLQEELRSHEADDLSRERLVQIHRQVVTELDETLSGYLREELEVFALPLGEGPTEAELRIAQAQLVGWLEGLFQGLQAATANQQVAAQQQLAQIREQRVAERQAPGQYL